LLLRWLFIARRRLAIESARRARDTAQPPPEAAAASASPTDIARTDEAVLDIPTLDLRTRKLISTLTTLILVIGLYGIWSDMLPALRMLERVQIWPRMKLLEATESPATRAFTAIITSGGTPSAWSEELYSPRPTAIQTTESNSISRSEAAAPFGPESLMPGALSASSEQFPGSGAATGRAPMTLADVGAAMIILLATLMAIRNVPGLIEIIVLQRLPLDAGTRNAISTIVRYAITIVGLSAGLGALGITWSSIQWLAAALTFGLAFGLQEIFANFISGLIILVERPIRVGDVVTTNSIT